ncbi:hypothetical protein FF17_21670 [Bacillus subtilis]|nr:hypothetical protein [Bacillus subtilis]MBG9624508.1 hypothetical protein [Bacillus subtilis]RDB51915.1 hypothetical protein DT062_07615 [Bacillus subtilis subsp. subtilis]
MIDFMKWIMGILTWLWNMSLGKLYEEKSCKFSYLNGKEILKMFDQIKPIINKILDLVEEIKYEMLKKSVCENQDLIDG